MTLLERIQAARTRRYPEWVQRMLEGRLPAKDFTWAR